jgi:hypothetical protein
MFLAVGKGLCCRPGEKLIARFVFPDMHRTKNERVTMNVTTWLHDDRSEVHKRGTSAKSLRKGGNTAPAIHPLISKDERLVRGAWAAADMSDKQAHCKDVDPALSQHPPFLALAYFKDSHARMLPMRLCPQLGTAAPDEIVKLQS